MGYNGRNKNALIELIYLFLHNVCPREILRHKTNMLRCHYSNRTGWFMPVIKKNAVVPYSPAEMYELVNQVEHYPDFLPWCQEAVIHERNADEVKATLVLAWGGMQKSFTTHNRLQHHKMIEVRLVEGPFRQLEGFWLFEDVDGACRIDLNLEFEFSNALLSIAFGGVFHQVANTLVDAFCQRADVVYGKSLA